MTLVPIVIVTSLPFQAAAILVSAIPAANLTVTSDEVASPLIVISIPPICAVPVAGVPSVAPPFSNFCVLNSVVLPIRFISEVNWFISF
ncbi:hypothetical protein [Pallidibacillus thermolactis]|uniref:hypothetical protein n=1 Tax=Pallidibacillus thermolactis TaxID=251051 RepID=UPI002E1D7442|nr:hypothetical protein [Pallidibacillus thermolactis subsp. kokeshiiformis]